MSADVLKTYRETIAPKLQKPFLKKVFKKLGLDVYKHRKGHVYCPEKLVTKAIRLLGAEEILPFREIAFDVVNTKKTLLGYDRLYTIYQAILNVRNRMVNKGDMAEVGVFKGGATYFIASVVQRVFDNKPKIHAFDTFEGHPGEDIEQGLDGPHSTEKFVGTSFAQVQHYLSVFPNVILHKGRFQDRCMEIAGHSFCFAHIDVDLYKSTLASLDFFANCLLPGGIMVVDDYGFKTCRGAKLAVDEFLSQRDNFYNFHLHTGQCLLIRVL